jgi:transcriptional regulator with XRE-family HTH domain
MPSNDHRSRTNPLQIDQGRTRSVALWRHIGQRMRLRRTQLRLEADAVARKLGVSPQIYAQYESGQLQTPAMLLSDVAFQFRLPVTWFFQDLPFDGSAEGTATEEQGVFSVATDEERIETLTGYFRSLDLEGQQHLLLVARTLFRSRKGSGGSET